MTRRYILVLIASVILTQLILQAYIAILSLESLVIVAISTPVAIFIAKQKE